MPSFLARSTGIAAAWFGFGAAALGCFIAVLSALVLWIPDSAASGTSGSTMRAGVLTFLAAQRGGVQINGVNFGFVPFGLPLLAAWLCWRSGRALLALPEIVADPRPRRLVRLVGLAVVAYAGTCLVLTHFATLGSSSAPVVGVVAGAFGVGAVGFGGAALVDTVLGRTCWSRLPTAVRSAVRAAVGAVTVLVGGGALLALASIAVHASRFMAFSRGMGRGFSGLPIALLDVLAAPNAALASTAYLAGPGFAVGQGITYSPFGGHGGLVPAFAMLAGLPNGQQPSVPVLLLIAVTLCGAGAAAGLLVRRFEPDQSWLAMIGRCLLAGVLAGVLLAILVALTGGSLGAHRLSTVGASPWRVGLAVAGEIGVLTLVTAVAHRAVAIWRVGRGSSDVGAVATKPVTGPAEAKVDTTDPVPAAVPEGTTDVMPTATAQTVELPQPDADRAAS